MHSVEEAGLCVSVLYATKFRKRLMFGLNESFLKLDFVMIFQKLSEKSIDEKIYGRFHFEMIVYYVAS